MAENHAPLLLRPPPTMTQPLWTTFPLLEALRGFEHRFTLRHPAIPVDADRAEAVERLWAWHREQTVEMGFAANALCIAQQVHGSGVAVIDAAPTAPL